MYDLSGNSSGGVFAESIDWGAASGTSAGGENTGSSGGWSWGGLANAIGAAANGYATVLAAGQVNRNPDSISTPNDRNAAQDYELRVPQQVGFQLNTGTMLMLAVVAAVAAVAFIALKD